MDFISKDDDMQNHGGYIIKAGYLDPNDNCDGIYMMKTF